MATSDQTLSALNEVRGYQKPDDVGIGEWIWGALQGDFNPDRTNGQIGFDMGVSLVPVVDTILDLRDLVANIRLYRKDPDNKVTMFLIATTAIGFIPEIGTVAKSGLRLVWVYLKPLIKHADDFTNVSKLVALTNRACDLALPRLTEYLQHNQIAKWATRGKIPDVYKFISKNIRAVGDKIHPAVLKRLLNEKFDALRALFKKIRMIVRPYIRTELDDILKSLDEFQKAISECIQEYAQPIRTVLKVLSKRLDDQAWRVEILRTNRGWIAPISEVGSARLINAMPPPWVKRVKGSMDFPPLDLKSDELAALLKNHPNHPQLHPSIVATFSERGTKLVPDNILGPQKLYRIIDPTSEGAGMFWMSDAEFKATKSLDEWRRRFGVKPEWNQNGWFVEYEVQAGETLAVWRGPAASQKLAGTAYYLEGGGEQIVFFPGKRDEMHTVMPRVDPKTGEDIRDYAGNLDRRVEFTDVAGEKTPVKLRKRITDPHIKGPIETGWGATDYSVEEAKKIILNLPISF
jgi:hypothetical protein